MFHYHAFGLNIGSELRLPELLTADTGCDASIRLESKTPELSPVSSPSGWLKLTRQDAVLSIEGVASFRLRSGCDVIVTMQPHADESLIRLYLLGLVLGSLLYQRGKIVLHASSVAIDGCAVAFLGNSGWGKSSIAAALLARGHDVVTDDVTAVNLDSGCATVFPGPPMLKVKSDVSRCLGIDPGSLFFLHPKEVKRGLRVSQQNSRVPLPLTRVYVLGEGSDLKVKPLWPREAVIELVRHSYPTRFLYPGDALHLRQCGQLASAVPVFSLERVAELSSLPDLARLIEETVGDKHG